MKTHAAKGIASVKNLDADLENDVLKEANLIKMNQELISQKKKKLIEEKNQILEKEKEKLIQNQNELEVKIENYEHRMNRIRKVAVNFKNPEDVLSYFDNLK